MISNYSVRMRESRIGVIMNKLSVTLISAAILGFTGFAGPPANAASAKCGERTKLIEILKKNYKEVPVALGISQKNTEAFEIFASEEGTWTVIMTMSTGQTCIMAAGHSWRDLPKQVAGIES